MNQSEFQLPNEIIITRNLALFISFLEIIISALLLVAYRSSNIIYFIGMLTLISISDGIIAKIRLSYYALLVHGMFSIFVFGGLFIHMVF